MPLNGSTLSNIKPVDVTAINTYSHSDTLYMNIMYVLYGEGMKYYYRHLTSGND